LTCSLRENRRATSAVRRRGHLLLPSLALVMLRCDATSAYSLDVLAAPWIRSSRSGGSPLLVAPATPQPTSEMGATLRSDFAILDQSVWDGKPLSYLDSAATSQKPQAVLAEMTRHLEADNANVHRGAHLLSARSTESYEGARDKVARFIGATDRREVIFTRGATEAINLVANTWGAANLQSGDEIVLSVMEHHSNLVPWQLLAKRTGVVIKYAQLDDRETLDVAHLGTLITSRTKLVSIAHVSNTLGCVNPAAEIAEMAHAVGAVLMLDACQSVPHMPVDVDALGCDFLVASGHKMCGPTGIGFLWGRVELLEAMPPWQGGGEMIDTVTFDTVTFAPPPGKFEAGTPAITQAIGLGAACDYLMNIGMEKVEAYEHELAVYLHQKLSTIPGIRIYGPDPAETGTPRAALCAFNIEGLHAADLATFLDQEGIAIRAGHHCTQPLHSLLGAAGSARASLYIYNSRAEVDSLCEAITETVTMFAELDA